MNEITNAMLDKHHSQPARISPQHSAAAVYAMKKNQALIDLFSKVRLSARSIRRASRGQCLSAKSHFHTLKTRQPAARNVRATNRSRFLFRPSLSAHHSARFFGAGACFGFAWIQHMLHHLASQGSMALLLANGSLSSGSAGEGQIRQALIEADLVECMVALPGQLFTNTHIPLELEKAA